jgi:hypothetical protein
MPQTVAFKNRYKWAGQTVRMDGLAKTISIKAHQSGPIRSQPNETERVFGYIIYCAGRQTIIGAPLGKYVLLRAHTKSGKTCEYGY